MTYAAASVCGSLRVLWMCALQIPLNSFFVLVVTNWMWCTEWGWWAHISSLLLSIFGYFGFTGSGSVGNRSNSDFTLNQFYWNKPSRVLVILISVCMEHYKAWCMTCSIVYQINTEKCTFFSKSPCYETMWQACFNPRGISICLDIMI